MFQSAKLSYVTFKPAYAPFYAMHPLPTNLSRLSFSPSRQKSVPSSRDSEWWRTAPAHYGLNPDLKNGISERNTYTGLIIFLVYRQSRAPTTTNSLAFYLYVPRSFKAPASATNHRTSNICKIASKTLLQPSLWLL